MRVGGTASSSRFDPIAQLDALSAGLKKRFAFDVKAKAQAIAWQKRARAALGETLGFLDLPKVPPRPREIESVDRGSYIRRKIVIRTSAHSELPLYLLVPKSGGGQCPPYGLTRGKRPCVLALHGHGYGVKDIVGLWEDGSERLSPDGYHRDFAVALAERGFVVAAPEISCFGERQMADPARFRANGMNPTCHNAATYAMMLGKSVAGLRVLDELRVVDYVRTLKEVDGDNIGVMGISGGGMHAFFSACMDTRIKASVISGYFCDWRRSILSIYHCSCNFVPGLLTLGELSDLAGLIAPRACLIEHGTHDEIFPIEHVKRTVEKARRAWKVFGAEENLETDYFEGRHRINGPAAYAFLAKHLEIKSR
jgi:dienelactone hydrolase